MYSTKTSNERFNSKTVSKNGIDQIQVKHNTSITHSNGISIHVLKDKYEVLLESNKSLTETVQLMSRELENMKRQIEEIKQNVLDVKHENSGWITSSIPIEDTVDISIRE